MGKKMKKYVGIPTVGAKPMTRGAYIRYRGWAIPADENPLDDGFLVVYPDGYRSWCPKPQFDNEYTLVDGLNDVPRLLNRIEEVLGTKIHFSKQVTDLYKAYGSVTAFKNFRGDPMPKFGDLPEKIQEAWQAAANI